MKSFTRKKTIVVPVCFALVLLIQGVAAAPLLPNPVLAFMYQEHTQVGGKQIIRYHYDIANKNQYPAEMFAAAPNLAPCGTNTNSSRTWIDVYNQNGKRLQGFCALTKVADLDKLWFAMEEGVVPPSWVYVEFTDRQTNTKYKSNLAETTQ